MLNKTLEQIYIENIEHSNAKALSINLDKETAQALLTMCYDNISNKKYIDIAGKISNVIQMIERSMQ